MSQLRLLPACLRFDLPASPILDGNLSRHRLGLSRSLRFLSLDLGADVDREFPLARGLLAIFFMDGVVLFDYAVVLPLFDLSFFRGSSSTSLSALLSFWTCLCRFSLPYVLHLVHSLSHDLFPDLSVSWESF